MSMVVPDGNGPRAARITRHRCAAMAAAVAALGALAACTSGPAAGPYASQAASQTASHPPADGSGALSPVVQQAARAARAGAVVAVQGCGLDGVVAAGVADRRSRAPMPTQEPLRIGSVGKLYVAALIHQLAQEGRLDLDRPVVAQLPAGALDGIAGATATPRQLLNHTGGVPDYYTDRTIAEWDWTLPVTAARVLDAVRGLPATAAPGAAYAYSNTGWHILGLLAESVTGADLELLLRERILVPLDLHDTRYHTGHPGGTIRGYGLPGQPDRDTFAYAENSGADSGVAATPLDVTRFLAALFLPGGRLEPLGQAMQADPVQRDGPRKLAGPGAEITIGSTGLRLVGHTGDVAGYLTFAFAAPELDVAMMGQVTADRPEVLVRLLRDTIGVVQARCAAMHAASPSR